MLALMQNGLASPLKKSFFAVLNSHSVQEHYQSDHAEKSRWRGFRSDGADRQADKEYGAAAQRKAADAKQNKQQGNRRAAQLQCTVCRL